MSNVVTEEKLHEAMKAQTKEIAGIFQGFMGQVDERFNKIEAEISGLNDEITGLKDEISELRQSHDRLLNTIDGFIARIDKYETELAARDRQFERLLEWARKVSEKTGIPLENL